LRILRSAQIVQRFPRSPNPVVHYGIFASLNQVIRNGLKRGDISKKLGGVLYFCDGGSSTDEYVPLPCHTGNLLLQLPHHLRVAPFKQSIPTAAAYTKELLGEVKPAKVLIIDNTDDINILLTPSGGS
jgi:hypothetical protein